MTQQTKTKQIRKGWREELLTLLTEKVADRNHVTPKYVEMGIPLISPRDFLEGNGINFNTKKFISEKDFIEDYKKVDFKEKDILLSRIGTIGKVRILQENIKFMALHSIVQIRAKDEKITPLFLYYALQSFNVQNQIEKGVKSIGTPDLGIDKIRNLIISYPESKEEQSAIVSAIETQFTRLDESVKSLQAVKQKLEVYRKAVLKKAFERNWKNEKMGNICIINPSKTEVKNLDENLSVSFIPMAYVSERGKIISMDKRPLKEVKKGFTFFKNDDVLLAKITPCFENGKKAIAENLVNGIGFGTTEFYVFRAKEGIIPKWIYYNISREDFRALAKRSMGGAVGQQRISKTTIENFEVPVPSIQEQQQIVQSIEDKFSVIDKLEQVIETSLQKAEKLRKSILKSAFEGKLVKLEEAKQ